MSVNEQILRVWNKGLPVYDWNFWQRSSKLSICEVYNMLWWFGEEVYLWWKFLALLSRCEVFAVAVLGEGLLVVEISGLRIPKSQAEQVWNICYGISRRRFTHDGIFWPCSSRVQTREVFALEFSGEGLSWWKFLTMFFWSAHRWSSICRRDFRRRFTHDGNFWPCLVLISQVEQMWCMCSRVLRRRFVF